MYKIVENFVSINGEGKKAGQLAHFIRFKGCNLECSYCDTKWANKEDTAYKSYDKEELLDLIQTTGIKNLTITGGEPLIQNRIENLLIDIEKLNNYNIEIETNGSVDIGKIKKLNLKNLSLTMDYKMDSSLMENRMKLSNLILLDKNDVLKFVVGSKKDLLDFKRIINKYDLIKRTNVYLSSVFTNIEPTEVAEFMIDNKIDANFQLQMHKYIWDPDKKGV